MVSSVGGELDEEAATRACAEVSRTGGPLPAGDRLYVARFSSTGAPDPAFGGGDGVFVSALTRPDDPGLRQIFGAAVEPDGAVVVGVRRDYLRRQGFLLLRLDSSGALDAGFGGSGVASLALQAKKSGVAPGSQKRLRLAIPASARAGGAVHLRARVLAAFDSGPGRQAVSKTWRVRVARRH